ncbi:unnamed protein product [Caenorhabditis bovis]|uniref:CTCK domain-containing protein n=1 Tax=Caenorhabditis bovis TaxID=2654633 RepID=A0A8S1EA73_9PELO|nr:unnamed protein product [Caenorhabditis bovis]
MGSPSAIALQLIRNCGSMVIVYLLLFSSLLHSTTAGLMRKDCKKVGAEELIDEEGCDLMIVQINRCSGHCLSFTFPNPLTKKISVQAKCCRMTEWEMLETELKCDGGSRQLRIPSALQCECFDCAVQ